MALLQDYKVLNKRNTSIKAIFNQGQLVWPRYVEELPPDPREPLYFDYSDKEYYLFWVNFIWSGGPEIDIYYSTKKVGNDPSRDWDWGNYEWYYLGTLSEDNPQLGMTGNYGQNRFWIKAECQYTWANSRSEYNYIETNAKVIGGNIMSLVGNYYSNPDNYSMNSYCFANLFNAPWAESIDRIVLPATTVNSYGYYNLFSGCSSITKAPELPATEIYQGAYEGMFRDCNLSKAPELHVTELASSCFRDMFRGCSSLTQAPQLPYTTLANYCYSGMFTGCSNLNYIKCLANSNISTSNTADWLKNVSATGTFVKKSGVTWPTGASGIPSGWTVVEQ